MCYHNNMFSWSYISRNTADSLRANAEDGSARSMLRSYGTEAWGLRQAAF